MTLGLSGRQFRVLMQIILSHAESFQKVILFGSRARGDARQHSDVDLAIVYRQKNAVFQTALEESNLSFTVDVVDLALENETALLSFIEQDGVVLYDADNKKIGAQWMTNAILNEKLQDFQKALSKLQEALSKDIASDDLYLDGTIQRFEFTYELAWKLMKAYLHYLGVDVNNPRAAIRESIKQTVISEEDAWFDMIEKRNETTHTYHKEIALSVYSAVKMQFTQLLADFEKCIAELIRKT